MINRRKYDSYDDKGNLSSFFFLKNDYIDVYQWSK